MKLLNASLYVFAVACFMLIYIMKEVLYNTIRHDTIPVLQERMTITSENHDFYYRFSHAYSIWLQPAEQDIFHALQRVIKAMGKKYQGTFHQPHATLYGALYTGDEEYVKAIAAEVASTTKPFLLRYKSIDCKQPNNTKRWRAGVTIRYHQDRSFMNAANITMLAYNQSDMQKPHTSLLYDFNGDSYRDPLVLNTTIDQLETILGYPIEQLKWKADTIHVYYTPLRDHWKSSKDMEEIVGRWKRVASYRMMG